LSVAKLYVGVSYPVKCKPGSFLIAWWLGRPYSHSYIRFESSKLPSNVYQAAHGMVHFREFGKFKQENCVVREYEIEVSEEVRMKTLINCVMLAGDKYGYADLVKIFGADLVYYSLGKELDMGDSPGYVCSELVGKLLAEDLGFKFDRPTHLLKPSHIDDALKSLGYPLSAESKEK